MTLVVALRCIDGVVLASDSQATSGASGALPWEYFDVRELGVPKIRPINDHCVMAIAGTVSFSQDIERLLDEQRLSGAHCFEVKDAISTIIWEIKKNKLAKFSTAYPFSEAERRTSQYLGDVIFVGFDGASTIRIFHINEDGESEEIESSHSIGSGEVFTRSTMKDYYKGNEPLLNCDAGEVLAYLLIKDAENTGAYGVGSPIKIQTFRMNDNAPVITMKDESNESEIGPIKDVYKAIKESKLSVFRR